MNTSKILESEIASLKVASLPTRPTAPSALGGRGYTASDMKAAFDRLPLFIVERLNCLIEEVSELEDPSLAGAMPTGILEGQTLNDLLNDIKTGAFASYLQVLDKPLCQQIEELTAKIEELNSKTPSETAPISTDGGLIDNLSPSRTGIRHLRGDEEAWERSEYIIPEGEIALSYQKDGNTVVKIGDGKQPFRTLDPLGCRIRFSDTPTLTLQHGTHTWYTSALSLEVFLPGSYQEDFYSILSFDSGEPATAISYPSHIFFGGDDVTDGVFIPATGMHYTVTFYQAGRLCATVRAVALHSSKTGLTVTQGSRSVGVMLPNKEAVSDIQIVGSSSAYSNRIGAIGEYDPERDEYCIQIRTHNCNLISYENFAECFFETYKDKKNITIEMDEDGFSYQTVANVGSHFIGNATWTFPAQTRIRIRFRMKPDCAPTNEIFNTGLLVSYKNSGGTEHITSAEPYTSEEGVLIDYLAKEGISGISVSNVSATKKKILKEDFLILADIGSDSETEAEATTYEIWTKAPLHGLSSCSDTLSLDDGSIIRNFVSIPFSKLATMPIRLESSGEICIFAMELEKEGADPMEALSWNFSSVYSSFEFMFNPSEYQYLIEGTTLYFTLSSSVITPEEAAAYFANSPDTLLYQTKESRVEKVEVPKINVHLPFTAFEVPGTITPTVRIYHHT